MAKPKSKPNVAQEFNIVRLSNITHYTLATKPLAEYSVPAGGSVRIEANTVTMKGFHHVYNSDGIYMNSVPAVFHWDRTKVFQ